jgi:histidyl-tRNA synthetase
LAKLQPIRGTRDLLTADCRRHRHIAETARALAQCYGYAEIATPMLEFTEVFARGMGEGSDVVTKEMYTFADRSGDSITLRPEYTAGICRALLSNGLHQQLPLKLFAEGAMFRFERPQKGRLRQFHQIDIEAIGAAEPEADVEIIALAVDLLATLKLKDQCVLELNTLGDGPSRREYVQVLIKHFEARRKELSVDSQRRLERNPLRIFDSKEPADRRAIEEAPKIIDYLNEASLKFFAKVRSGLDRLGLAYRLNPKLVRGLDYYTHTAFEFTTTALGAQGAVIAGGRYDGLIEALGGPPIPGTGWAAGIERLALLLPELKAPPRPIALVPIGETAENLTAGLARDLRARGLCVELAFAGSVTKRLKLADRARAAYAVIIGDDELARGRAKLRNLDTGEQCELALADLSERLLALK